jgi:hypothetical protein
MPGVMVYWNWFEKMVVAGKITSHKKVIKEILAGGEKKGQADPLITWVKTRQEKLAESSPDSEECQALVGELCQFSYDTYGPAKTIEFTKGADLWLIARAKLDDGAVVTQESEKKPVRIPAVCTKFGVRFMPLYQMNKELNMKL